MSSFINPMEDFCAKELFENEVVRTYFLSDILDIPLESIKSTRIINPILNKLRKEAKQGILDVKIELNNNTKINIEIQVVQYDFWSQRNMFYLTKMFTEDLVRGQNYGKLKKCIGISILDYNYSEGAEYHSIYKYVTIQPCGFTATYRTNRKRFGACNPRKIVRKHNFCFAE